MQGANSGEQPLSHASTHLCIPYLFVYYYFPPYVYTHLLNLFVLQPFHSTHPRMHPGSSRSTHLISSTPSLASLIQCPSHISLPLAAIQQASFHSHLFYQAPGLWQSWAELAHPGSLPVGAVGWTATNKWALCSFADPMEMEYPSSGQGL